MRFLSSMNPSDSPRPCSERLALIQRLENARKIALAAKDEFDAVRSEGLQTEVLDQLLSAAEETKAEQLKAEQEYSDHVVGHRCIAIVRTTERAWVVTLAEAYRNRAAIWVIDDAEVGIDPANQTLFDMARQSQLTPAEIAAVCIAVGVSAVGVGMILLAFFDPEPTSKLGLLVGGGIASVLLGGSSALFVLTKLRPPNIKIGPAGIGLEISWR